MHKIIITVLFFALSIAASAQSDRYISFTQKAEILDKGKKLSSETGVYFDKVKTTIVKHITLPEEAVTATNALGETEIYYPKTNHVSFLHLESMSSKRNLIYYFANNFTDHLGLADEGFSLISRNYEDNYLVTMWQAPASIHQIDKVKMVFEQGIPIFAEYLNVEGKSQKKIYYSQYQDLYSFRMPMKVIEISYKPSGDSIVSRTIFSDMQISGTPNSEYFNFKTPDDAIPMEKK